MKCKSAVVFGKDDIVVAPKIGLQAYLQGLLRIREDDQVNRDVFATSTSVSVSGVDFGKPMGEVRSAEVEEIPICQAIADIRGRDPVLHKSIVDIFTSMNSCFEVYPEGVEIGSGSEYPFCQALKQEGGTHHRMGKETTNGGRPSNVVWDNLQEWVRRKVQEFVQSLLDAILERIDDSGFGRSRRVSGRRLAAHCLAIDRHPADTQFPGDGSLGHAFFEVVVKHSEHLLAQH